MEHNKLPITLVPFPEKGVACLNYTAEFWDVSASNTSKSITSDHGHGLIKDILPVRGSKSFIGDREPV